MHCDRLGLGHTLSKHLVVTMTTNTTFLQFEVVNSVIYSCKLALCIHDGIIAFIHSATGSMVAKIVNFVCSLEFVVSACAENTMFQQSIELILK